MTKGLFATLDIYYNDDEHSAAMNMAIDEALLDSVAIPSIRFYRWRSPALSFGYFGKFADVVDYAAERDLVRRWTGGGIVFHGQDLTYSIAIPTSDPVFSESSRSIYEKIHRALCNALAAKGERAELAPVAGVVDAGAAKLAKGAGVTEPSYNADPGYGCFANPVRADVMLNGRKIAGAAQRRTRRGLLQQGTIQLAIGRVRPAGGNVDLGNGLAQRFARALAEARCEKSLDKSLMERAEKIAEQKYGTDSWLRRR
jgi:lipoyl(octanoyl) transferase